MPSIFIIDHGRDVIHLTVFQKDLDQSGELSFSLPKPHIFTLIKPFVFALIESFDFALIKSFLPNVVKYFTHISTFFLQIGVIIVDKLNQIVQSFILRMILLMSGLILWEIRPRRSDSSDLYTYNNIQYHKIQLKISSCKSLCTILKIENKR